MGLRKSKRALEYERINAALKEARLLVYESRVRVGRAVRGSKEHALAQVELKERQQHAKELRLALKMATSCDNCGTPTFLAADGMPQWCSRCFFEDRERQRQRRKEQALAGRIPT